MRLTRRAPQTTESCEIGWLLRTFIDRMIMVGVEAVR